MTRLVGAELLKLRTVRIGWVFLFLALAFVGIVLPLALALHDEPWADQDARDLFSIGGTFLVPLFVLLLGVFGFTAEFRHGTIAQTFLVTPRRERVLAAKLVAYCLVGIAFVALATALTVAIAIPWLRSDGVDVSLFDPPIRAIVAGGIVAGALWGPLGVAVGAAVRNQVGGVIGVLVWLLVVESIATGLFPDESRFLPGRAADALAGTATEDVLTRPQGALVLLAWLAAFTLAAGVLLRRRDVT